MDAILLPASGVKNAVEKLGSEDMKSVIEGFHNHPSVLFCLLLLLFACASLCLCQEFVEKRFIPANSNAFVIICMEFLFLAIWSLASHAFGGEPYPFIPGYILFGFIILSCSLVLNFVTFVRQNKNVLKREMVLISMFINMTALVTMYSSVMVGEPMTTTCRHGYPVSVGRYVEWLTTTPMFVYLFSLMISFKGRPALRLRNATLATDVLMITTGFLGDYFCFPYNVLSTLISVLAFAQTLRGIHRMVECAMAEMVTETDRRRLRWLLVWTDFTWGTFSLVWLILNVGLITPETADKLYVFCDSVTKSGYAVGLVMGNFYVLEHLKSVKEIEQEELVLNSMETRFRVNRANEMLELVKDGAHAAQKLEELKGLLSQLTTPLNNSLALHSVMMQDSQPGKSSTDMVQGTLEQVHALLEKVVNLTEGPVQTMGPQSQEMAVRERNQESLMAFSVREPFNLSDIVNELIDVVARKADQAGVDLVVDIHPLLFSLQLIGNPSHLRSVLVTAVENIIVLSQTGNAILVSAWAIPHPTEGFVTTCIRLEDRVKTGQSVNQLDGSDALNWGGTSGPLMTLLHGVRRSLHLLGGELCLQEIRGGEEKVMIVNLPMEVMAKYWSYSSDVTPSLPKVKVVVMLHFVPLRTAVCNAIAGWGAQPVP
ncbi:hypothetical protein CYMTET_30197, partial [Cymbomonas tetramitiformis]